MEVVVRVSLFYVLDNIFNYILGQSQPNSYSSIMHQSDSCFAEKLCSNSAKINPLKLFIISSCLILVATPLKNVVRFIKWSTPLASWCFYYFGAHSSVTLSNPLAMALRVTICLIVFYSIYSQYNVELRAKTSTLWILKYLIPFTLWLWILNYLKDDCNVVLSHYSLIALRLATFFIAFFAVIMSERESLEKNQILGVVYFFLFFTFGLRTAEGQYHKYRKLIDLMRDMFHKNEESVFGKLEYSLIGLTFFIIQLSSSCNYFPRTLSDLMEWSFLQEIYNTDSVTVLRYLIIRQFLLYLNKSILKVVHHKLLQNCTFEISLGEAFLSPLNFLIFAIDSQFLNSNAESRWNMLRMCFLINCGAFLSSICDLIEYQKGKKHHHGTLNVSLFTFVGAILLLSFSFWTEQLSVHFLLIASSSIYVILAIPLVVSVYFLKDVAPYNENEEAPHRALLITMILLVLKYCSMITLFVTFYLISTQGDFCLHVFHGAIIVGLHVYKDLKNKHWVFVTYVRIRSFIYLVGEVQQEVLKELNDICPICREEMVVSGCVTLCRHYYHKHCLLSWLYKSNTCPMCQSELYALYPTEAIN